MKVRPLGDRILVQRVEPETKTKSGIYLPESATDKPQQAKVIALGQGRLLDNGERAPFQVKEGDTVLLGKWGGTEVKLDDKEFVVLGEDEVLAVVA
ncbi:co-chaperone GroES [Phycisphaerales bacterium AB-hyl4]|uniref:Co-chaperonin GroES n=1 Tax=Natronomicrosphaera hydrolytica TaxID=3242702 RepID=A0ABV4U0J8_9BACT